MLKEGHDVSEFVARHIPFLRFLMDFTTRIMNVKGSSVLIYDSENDKLVFTLATGFPEDDLKSIALEPTEGIAGWVYKNRAPILTPDVRQDRRWSARVAEHFGVETKSIACAPLLDEKGAPIGVIEIVDKNSGESLTADDLARLEILAEIVARSLTQEFALRAAEKKIASLTANASAKGTIIGSSPILLKKIEEALRVAPSRVTVLLTGESGVGKELMANLIHENSPRAKEPLMKINCGALPESLLERELFGHLRGAFTGADRSKPGLFQAADKGTILLDEIGETSKMMQVKLLRVLQEGVFIPIGGSQEVHVDTRIIAATNRNLEEMVVAKDFREDLYYRLNVVKIAIPPLRERADDIVELAIKFLEDMKIELSRPELALSREALDDLKGRSWPGNVRQLRNAIERAAILSENGLITPSDFPREPIEGAQPEIDQNALDPNLSLKEAQNRFRKLFLTKSLATHRGNRTQTARALGIQRTYLSKLIREFNLGE